MREGENALEHEGHDGDENKRAPNLVRKNAIELVAEGFTRGREFSSDGLLDFCDARVTPFNGCAAPIYFVSVQSLAGGGDCVLNFL